MAKHTLRGPIHPLVELVRRGDAERRQYEPAASRMIKEHYDRAAAYISVFGVENGVGRYLGPEEDYGHLLSQPGYVRVGGRDNGVANVAGQMAGTSSAYAAAVKLLQAAHGAAPMVDALLAVTTADGDLEWDTGESVQAVAWRLCLDAAERLRIYPRLSTGPADVYGELLVMLGFGPDAEECARRYLKRRREIQQALSDAGIEWGPNTVIGPEAAERAGVASSTWRAYVARGEAPDEDLPGGRWYKATIDAWRLTRPRVSNSWWRG